MTEKKVYLYPEVIGTMVEGEERPYEFGFVDMTNTDKGKCSAINVDLLRQYEALGAYEIDIY